MDTVNRTLLAEVTKKRLEEALSEGDDEKRDTAFRDAMVAVEKEIEIEKNDASKDEAKMNRYIQIGTFAAGLIVSPLIEYSFKKTFAKMLCEFEKDYTFTTTAGRSLSSLFRFKK